MPENWCKIFDTNDFEILSYLNDLKQYWLKSYGNEINSKMTFILIQDLLHHFESHLFKKVNSTKLVLRFGHAENIFPLLTSLGLFKDEQKLMASNFELNLQRKFKSAILSPFSSNVAFVLNKCDQIDYKVSLFVNELPISQINAGDLLCTKNNNKFKLSESVCDYSEFKSHLNKYINFEYEEVCTLNKNMKTEL